MFKKSRQVEWAPQVGEQALHKPQNRALKGAMFGVLIVETGPGWVGVADIFHDPQFPDRRTSYFGDHSEAQEGLEAISLDANGEIRRCRIAEYDPRRETWIGPKASWWYHLWLACRT